MPRNQSQRKETVRLVAAGGESTLYVYTARFGRGSRLNYLRTRVSITKATVTCLALLMPMRHVP